MLEGGKASPQEPTLEVVAIGRDLVAQFRRQPRDVVLVPVAAGERPLQGLGGHLDWGLAGALSHALTARADADWEELLVPGGQDVGAERVVLLAITPDEEGWAHTLGERMFGVVTALDGRRVAFAVPGLVGGLDAAVACLEGWNGAQDRLFGSGKGPHSALVCAQPAMVGRLARVLAGPIRPARG